MSKGNKKLGRPPLQEPRKVPVSLRLTEAEAKSLELFRTSADQKLANIVLRLIQKVRSLNPGG